MKVLVVLKGIDGAPRQFQLLPYGWIEIEGDKPAYVDEEAMALVASNFKRRGNKLVIDYEHQTLKDVEAPAAGWINEFIPRGQDGLWVDVDWTGRATNYLVNKEYIYFSPVMWVRGADRRVVSIQNVGLTNDPKVNNLKPIIAKMTRDAARDEQQSRSEKYKISVKEGGHVEKPGEWSHVPDDEFADPVNYRYPCPDADQTRAALSYWGVAENQAPYSPEERSVITERLNTFKEKFKIGESRKEAKMIQKLRKLLGLADDAGEDKAVEAVELLINKNTTLEAAAKDKPAEVVACKEILEAVGAKDGDSKELVVAKITGLKATDNAAEKLSLRVAELEQVIAKNTEDGLVSEALTNGQTSASELDAWGRDLAKTNPDQFKKIVLKRPRGSVVPLDQIRIVPDKDVAVMDDVQRQVNKMMGVDEETFKKYNAAPQG